MRQLKSVSPYESTQSLGFSIFLFCFGSVFIVMGLYAARDAIRAGIAGVLMLGFGTLIIIGFGVMIAGGSLIQANLIRKFGKAEGFTEEEDIRTGQAFRFIFRQPIRYRISTTNIGVFLVFREKVQYNDGSETQIKYFDRLVQSFTHDSQIYSAGEVIHQEHVFTVPNCAMGIRNAFMENKDAKVETSWVVKVRINLGKGYDVWKEYEIEINNESTESTSSILLTIDTNKDDVPRFDVYLTNYQFMPLFRVTNAMATLLPHLDAGQIGDLFHARPSLILERVTETEAKAAQEQIAAAGGFAKIQQSRD